MNTSNVLSTQFYLNDNFLRKVEDNLDILMTATKRHLQQVFKYHQIHFLRSKITDQKYHARTGNSLHKLNTAE